MKGEAFLALLQFSDGLFPVGSYAHSFGLETLAAEGTIRDAAGVESFLLAHLQGSVAPTDAVAALTAQSAVLAGAASTLTELLIIDPALDAMKFAGELRDASRQMGRQVLRIAANLDAFPLRALAADLLRAVEQGQTPGHHPVALGFVGAAFGWPEKELASAYLYSSCSGLVAAALRLLPLGQLAGQRILWSLAPVIAQLAEEIEGRRITDIWSFAPGIEIAAMRHATLDARLFRS